MKRESTAERRRKRGIRAAFAFAALCIVGGFVALPWAVGYVRNAQVSSGWPTAQGEIISREVMQSTRRNANAMWDESYLPRIHYSYEVDGQRYESTQIGFDFDAHYERQADARAVIDSVARTEPLTVYYEPGNPANAVLRTGGDWRTYRPLIFALAPLLLGIVTVFWARRSARRGAAEAAAAEDKRRARAAAKRAKTSVESAS